MFSMSVLIRLAKFATCAHVYMHLCCTVFSTCVHVHMHCVQHVCAYWTVYVCSMYKCLCTYALCSACVSIDTCAACASVYMRSCTAVSIYVCWSVITGTPLNHLVVVICPSSFTQLCATNIQTRTSCLRQGIGHGVCPICLCPKDCTPHMPSWRPL